jgi:hypothetical protein
MNQHLAYYVISYYGRFMTENEGRAHFHLGITMKATKGRSDALAQDEDWHAAPAIPATL